MSRTRPACFFATANRQKKASAVPQAAPDAAIACLPLGGDVDSFLALGLLMWGFEQR